VATAAPRNGPSVLLEGGCTGMRRCTRDTHTRARRRGNAGGRRRERPHTKPSDIQGRKCCSSSQAPAGAKALNGHCECVLRNALTGNFITGKEAAAAPLTPAWPRARACVVCRGVRRAVRAHTHKRLSSHWHRPGGRLAAQEAPGRGGDHPRRVCACVGVQCSSGRAKSKSGAKRLRHSNVAMRPRGGSSSGAGNTEGSGCHHGRRRAAAAMQAAARAQRPRGSCQRVSAEQVQETPSAWAGAVIARRASAVVHRACVRARVQQRIEGTGEGSWAAICRAGSRAGGCRKAPIAAGCLHRQTQNMGERGARIRTCMRQRRQAERTPQTATVLRPFAKPAPPRRPTDCPRERGPDRETTLDAHKAREGGAAAPATSPRRFVLAEQAPSWRRGAACGGMLHHWRPENMGTCATPMQGRVAARACAGAGGVRAPSTPRRA